MSGLRATHQITKTTLQKVPCNLTSSSSYSFLTIFVREFDPCACAYACVEAVFTVK